MSIKQLVSQNYKIAIGMPGSLSSSSRQVTNAFLSFFNSKIQLRNSSQSSKNPYFQKPLLTSLSSRISSYNIKNQKIPLGIQTIEDVLKNNYVYIDKTHFAKQLIEGGKYYFINRPRRFGKSLFISMLKSILVGNKELFKNQSIYQTKYDWRERSVIHLDFSQMNTRQLGGAEKDLEYKIINIAASHGIVLNAPSMETKFSALIEELFHKHQKKVAVLIDEYDKPLTDNLDEKEIADENRRLIRSFLGVLKGSDAYLDFVFVTGVSKFSHVSLFSGANQLKDITIHPSYAAMMGYTEKEMYNTLGPLIKNAIRSQTHQKKAVSKKQLFSKMEEIRSWYDGYRFSKEDIKVYNPHSILNYLEEKGEFKNYWMQSGSPAYLIKQIEKEFNLEMYLGGARVQEEDLLGHFNVDTINIPALMWQTGYFTIHHYDPVSRFYTLDFPNQEIKSSFSKLLMSHMTKLSLSYINNLSLDCKKSLENMDLQTFFDKINTQFATISYQVHKNSVDEKFFHISLSLLLAGMNIPYRLEESTNLGHASLLIDMDKHIYVIEIKKDKNAQAALDQMLEKESITKFKAKLKGKDIISLGINFDPKTKSINDWEAQVFSSEGEKKQQLSYAPKQK
ncbi:MAG: AAA family ATPase [Candidatus Rhabdochlamydia sp.]